MIALTSILIEKDTSFNQPGYYKHANGAYYPQGLGPKEVTHDAGPPSAPEKPAVPKVVVQQPPTSAAREHLQDKTAAAQSAQQANVGPAAPVQQAVRKVVVPQTEYQQNLRQTFNTLPTQGRNLRIAGTGQQSPVNPTHQAEFDSKFKQVAATNRNLNVAGVPAAPPAAPMAPVPPPTAHVASAPQEMSGTEHAMAAVKKGAKATGEAISTAGEKVASGAKNAAEHVVDHPLAVGAAVAGGAAVGAGLRRILRGKDKSA
jgi:hypothetical protein